MNTLRLFAVAAPVAFSCFHTTAHMEGKDSSSKHIHHQPLFGTNSTKRYYKHGKHDSPNLSNMSLISGTAHRQLAEEVSREMKLPLSQASLQRFADGEVSIQIIDNIRGQDVFIIQPCAAPVNDSIVELLLTVSCARRSGARRVIAVIPYFGYKHHRRGNAISTKHNSRFLWSGAGDFALMLQELGKWLRTTSHFNSHPLTFHRHCLFIILFVRRGSHHWHRHAAPRPRVGGLFL
jgi:hypothetical protein